MLACIGLMVSAVGELEKTVLAMFTNTRKVVMMRAILPAYHTIRGFFLFFFFWSK